MECGYDKNGDEKKGVITREQYIEIVGSEKERGKTMSKGKKSKTAPLSEIFMNCYEIEFLKNGLRKLFLKKLLDNCINIEGVVKQGRIREKGSL